MAGQELPAIPLFVRNLKRANQVVQKPVLFVKSLIAGAQTTLRKSSEKHSMRLRNVQNTTTSKLLSISTSAKALIHRYATTTTITWITFSTTSIPTRLRRVQLKCSMSRYSPMTTGISTGTKHVDKWKNRRQFICFRHRFTCKLPGLSPVHH